MSAPEAEAALERIFQDVMIGETLPVRQRTRLACLRWDSLMQLTLVSAIEQEFGLTLSDEDVLELNSFESALLILQEKWSNGHGV